MAHRETKDPTVCLGLKVLRVWKEGKVLLDQVGNLERKEKLEFLDFLDQLDEMGYLV